ncbi:hypothetical protein V2A60_007937 [Cordyceps javanica]|uniref:HAUS augmin-like complex subunit 4 n=1 Tax=Cordyceps javanica TaxID=43265 RepID=A0A545V9B4_9HYPO|nr:hypothetical protein IF1G_02390 [Cordyceps javanica]
MAHLRGRPEADAPDSMFSPSIARIAATEARDWSVVDSWVALQFPSRQPPPFERNADTLKALLDLIAFNDKTSEEARLFARVDRDFFSQMSPSADLEDTEGPATVAAIKNAILDIVQQELPKEGRVALHSMSSMAVSARVSLPEPECLAAVILDIQSAIFETEQMTSRTEALHRHIHSEIVHTNYVLSMIQHGVHNLRELFGKRNVELQRIVQSMTAQVPEFERRNASLKSSTASLVFTVHDILQEEQGYLALVENRKDLEKRISVFRGLPSDPDLARTELNAYRRELQRMTSRRDAAFQGLVERETPVKRR